ncbi:MAG: DUF4920 domain-containing protein [Thermodesulfobacteriota bacterium]
MDKVNFRRPVIACARIVLLALVCLGAFATAALAEGYGRPITLRQETALADILAAPGRYIGQQVLVRGTVAEVCAKRGCWMDIVASPGPDRIQIKVADGEIVFPMSARGRSALVQGTVEELSLSREDAIAYFSHKAEEKGVAFDPATVAGPQKIYRIRGLGAEID